MVDMIVSDDLTILAIVGIYVLLIYCLLFFFRIGVRISQLGKRLTQFESSYRLEADKVKEQIEEIRKNIESIESSLEVEKEEVNIPIFFEE